MDEIRTFGPYPHRITLPFSRADLEVYGIDHFRPSYDALVFFNDPELTAEEASEERPSYAGTFSIFGHADCWGGEGHCAVDQPTRRFDDRPSHPLTRAFKRIVATPAVQKAVDEGDELTITVVARCREEVELGDGEHLFDARGMQLATFG